MDLAIAMTLPREAVSVPVARKVVTSTLSVLGADTSVISDLGIAITEACSNVQRHAQDGEEYQVHIDLDDATCVIEVIDTGQGLGSVDLDHVADNAAERGRGIQLMRVLMDQLEFESIPGRTTTVRLTKQLSWEPDAAVQRLSTA